MGVSRADADRSACECRQQTRIASSTTSSIERLAMLGQSELSPTALRCLERQLTVALGLAVSCQRLSDRAASDGDPFTVVVLERVASDLTDLAGSLLPLVGVEDGATTSPLPEGSFSGADIGLAELGHSLGQAGLAAEVDAMSPGLEATVVRLLSKLAGLFESSGELLLALPDPSFMATARSRDVAQAASADHRSGSARDEEAR